MQHISEWTVLAITAGVLLVPGGICARLIGMRGLWALGCATPISVALLGCTSLVLPMGGLRWEPIPVLLSCTSVTGALWALFRFVPRLRVPLSVPPEPEGFGVRQRLLAAGQRGAMEWALPAAILGGAGVLAYRILVSLGEPEHVSQTFDAIFHLNAVRFILDTGSASALTLGELNSPGAAGPYPAAWHALASLVVQLSGATIPVAAWALSVLLGSIVFASGILLLVRQMWGSQPVVLLGTAALLAAFPSFPLLLLTFGVLYPLFLGVVILPAVLALVAHMCGLGTEWADPTCDDQGRSATQAPGLSPLGSWVLLAGMVPTLALAHPGALLAGIAAGCCFAVIWCIRALRGGGRVRGRRALLFTIVVLCGSAIVFVLVRPPSSHVFWRATTTLPGGFLEGLTLTMGGMSLCVPLVGFLWIGILRAAVRRTPGDLALLLLFVVFLGLFTVAAGLHHPWYRYGIVGPWYSDIPRLASFVPLAALPLAGLGLSTLTARLGRFGTRVLLPEGLPRRRRVGVRRIWSTLKDARALKIVLMAIVLLSGGVAGQLGSIMLMTEHTQDAHALKEDSPLLSPDERALFARLSVTVPQDSVIAGSPWTGAGMAYALTGHPVLMPHAYMGKDSDLLLINAWAGSATAGSSVCAALQRKGVKFILDFGTDELHSWQHKMPGVQNLSGSQAVQLVDYEGTARLFRITACEG